MTKTIKKWLVAVLLLVLAVTVGLTASTFKSASAEVDTVSAADFVEYMANFKGKVTEGENGTYTFSEANAAKFFGDKEDGTGDYYTADEVEAGAKQITHRNLWLSYDLAKGTYMTQEYASLSDEDVAAVEVEGFAEAIAMFKAVDVEIDKYYADASSISYNMTRIVTNQANFLYSSAKTIYDLYGKVEGYMAEGDKEDENYNAGGTYGFIKFIAGSNFSKLEEAKAIADARKALIEAFVATVTEIDYLDADSNYQESATDYAAEENQTIVIDSGASIKVATDALDKLPQRDVDYLYTGENGAEFEFVKYYDAYTSAKTTLGKLREDVDNVEKAIYDLYLAVTGSENGKYVLLIAEKTGYDAVKAMYDALPTAEKNNQQGLVDTEKSDVEKPAEGEPEEGEEPAKVYFTYKELLDSLKETLDGLNAKIDAVKTLITAAKDYVDKKYTGYYATVSYTVAEDGTVTAEDYKGAIQAAEAAFKALEKDIVDHDTAATEGYYVENYADLKAEIAAYKEWDAPILAIIDNVKELAAKIVNGPSATTGNFVNEIVALKNTVEKDFFKLNDDQYAFLELATTTVTVGEGDDADTRSVSDWRGEARRLAAEISASAGTLITDIANYTYSFALQEELVDLLQRYYKLSETNRRYVNNRSFLIGTDEENGHGGYVGEYEADLAKVAAWQEAVAAIEEGKVTVANKHLVEAAQAKFAELTKAGVPAYYTNYEKAEVAEDTDVTGKSLTGSATLTADEINAMLNVQYDSYMASYADKTTTTPGEGEGEEIVTVEKYGYASYSEACDALNAKIDNVVELVKALGNKESFSNLAVAETKDWAPKVKAITDALDELKDDSTLAEDALYSYEGAIDYIWTLADEDTYLEALKYVASYAVEGKIADIWADYEGNIDFTKDPDEALLNYISLKKATVDAIKEARKVYDAYDGEVTIRNYKFLEEAEKALDAIETELKAWAKTVDGLKMSTAGYGLDLDAWKVVFDNYATLVGGEWTETEDADAEGKVTVWVKNGDAYEAKDYVLTGEGVDKDKVDYKAVADAYAKLLSIYETSNTAVKGIDASMAEIIDHAANQEGGLSTADYENVKKINDNLDRMSPSQKALLENLDEYSDMDLSAVNAANAFNDLYMALYEKVITDKEVTSFTGIYAEMVDTIYQQFDQNVKALINSDYAEKMEEIRTAFDEADGTFTNGDITALEEAIEGLEGNIEKITTEIATLKGSIATLEEELKNADKDNADAIANEISARISAIEALKADLAKANEAIEANKKAVADLKKASEDADAALKAAYETADAALRDLITALEGKVTTLEGKVTTLEESMATAQGDIKTIQIQLADAFGKIGALETAKTQLEGKITELEGALDAYKAAETKAREDGDKALEAKIADEIKKVNDAIDAAKKALAGDIKTVSDGLAAADKAAKDATAAVNNLKSELDKTNSKVSALETANADLTKQVEDLQGKISGIVAGVIIVGLALGVAVAVFAVITLLRKKNS